MSAFKKEGNKMLLKKNLQNKQTYNRKMLGTHRIHKINGRDKIMSERKRDYMENKRQLTALNNLHKII